MKSNTRLAQSNEVDTITTERLGNGELVTPTGARYPVTDVTLTIITREAPTGASEAEREYQKRLSEKFYNTAKLLTLSAVCEAFGLPPAPVDADPRIVALAQKLPYSYDDIARWLVWCASILNKTVEECLAFTGADVAAFEKLCYCAIATKRWNAANRAPLQALSDDTRGSSVGVLGASGKTPQHNAVKRGKKR